MLKLKRITSKITYCSIPSIAKCKCNFYYWSRSPSRSEESVPEGRHPIRRSICNVCENRSGCLFNNVFNQQLLQKTRSKPDSKKILVVKYRCIPLHRPGELWWCTVNDVFVDRKILYKIYQNGYTSNVNYKIVLVVIDCCFGTERIEWIFAYLYVPSCLVQETVKESCGLGLG